MNFPSQGVTNIESMFFTAIFPHISTEPKNFPRQRVQTALATALHFNCSPPLRPLHCGIEQCTVEYLPGCLQ